MEVKKYLMINTNTNICVNIILWDGDETNYKPPEGYILLTKDDIKAVNWYWTGTEWTLTEFMGQGEIGYTWDGEKLTTPYEKPEDLETIPSTTI